MGNELAAEHVNGAVVVADLTRTDVISSLELPLIAYLGDVVVSSLTMRPSP